jgi:hypothetical protein
MKSTWLLYVLCGVTLCQVPTAAAQFQPSPSPAAAAGSARVPTAPRMTANGTFSAEVFFVNITGEYGMLAEAIGDLLLAHYVIPHFEHRRELTERDLLEKQQLGVRNRATVWILMPHPQAVRLVFADPELERFLVRELPLPQGLDELGRESIAQVVESSLLALLQGTTGMSRGEVQTALGRTLVKTPMPPRIFDPALCSGLPTKQKDLGASQTSVRPRLGVTYGLSYSGRDLGLQEGPGILSGLELVRSSDSLFLAGSFEWRFEEHHRTTEFDLAVQSNLMWLLLGWRKPLGGANLVAILGPGLELARVNPQLAASSTAIVGRRLVHPSPWLRASLGFEWDSPSLVFQILGTLDGSIYRTHYDIERDGHAEELASMSYVRPGITWGALWR